MYKEVPAGRNALTLRTIWRTREEVEKVRESGYDPSMGVIHTPEGSSMQQSGTRRSCRVAMELPIRVFGVDFRGIDFTEEALTSIVNLHGAKIRLSHQLLPDAEIRLFNH